MHRVGRSHINRIDRIIAQQSLDRTMGVLGINPVFAGESFGGLG